MHVSLTPKLEEMVREKVESGLYNNASEVIRDALRLMATQDELYQLKLERLREAISIGERDVATGSFTRIETDKDLKAFFDQI
ncbi:type II toxin-antitoxin system ParD family antitoxin [Lacibacterium aquatile]|uniref:Type II toxin-antitoxin system ParD family antitoxin n=1 Tax=Lacibacterium aquatile TaxID=1168082 RepID=A0ABW5DS61_9PROT